MLKNPNQNKIMETDLKTQAKISIQEFMDETKDYSPEGSLDAVYHMLSDNDNCCSDGVNTMGRSMRELLVLLANPTVAKLHAQLFPSSENTPSDLSKLSDFFKELGSEFCNAELDLHAINFYSEGEDVNNLTVNISYYKKKLAVKKFHNSLYA